MSSAAYASDGGSSTESEDEAAAFLEFNVKSEPIATTSTSTVEVASPLPAQPVVKSEAEVVESAHDEVDPEVKPEVKPEIKPELPVTDNATTTTTIDPPQPEQQPTEPEAAPTCSSCGYQLLIVPQAEILGAEEMLDCKCCGLVLPKSSYSNTQRSKEDTRKCKACTGNMAFREKRANAQGASNEKKAGGKSIRERKKRGEATDVFTNKVGRLKMAKMALQRKRDEVSKLKWTKRREEYEQQLDKEEKELARQEALLKGQRGDSFKRLMDELTIKKPPTYEQDRKQKARKTKANLKRKQKAKEQGEEPAKKKKKKKTTTNKGPAVDPSTYVPPASAAEAAPARVIPTRARTRAQTQAVEVKAEVKAEQPKVEPKTE